MKHSSIISRACTVSLVALLMLACSTGPTQPEPPAITNGLAANAAAPALRRVNDLRTERGPTALLRDEPAAVNVDRLRQAFRSKTPVGKLGLGVYQLTPVAEVAAAAVNRAATLGIAAAAKPEVAAGELRPERPWAKVAVGPNMLLLNGLSGDENFTNTDLFHRGPGSKSSLSDDEYLTRANAHAAKILANGSAVVFGKMFPYKLRRYMNAVATDGVEPDVDVYQVAVAYNDTIDDIPVIGSGGKVAVHMTVDGRVVGHEITVRGVRSKLAAFEWADLTDPEGAQQEIEERLKQRGIDLSQFNLTRTEFGYLRRGRNSIQEVVAPHYAFVYEPKPGVMGKKIYETVPATTNSGLRKILADDENRDRARKAALWVAPGARH